MRGLYFTNTVYGFIKQEVAKLENVSLAVLQFLNSFDPQKCSCFPSWCFEARNPKTGDRTPVHIDKNDKFGPSLCVMQAAPGLKNLRGVSFCTEDGVWEIPAHHSGNVLVGMFSGDCPHGTVCMEGQKWWGWTAVQHRPDADPPGAKVRFCWDEVGPVPAAPPDLQRP